MSSLYLYSAPGPEVLTKRKPNRKSPRNLPWAWREEAHDRPRTIPRNDSRMFFFLIGTLLFQESLAQVRAVDGGMAGAAVGGLGGEGAGPGGRCGMAAEAQVCGALMGQHEPVVRAVNLVPGGAALDAGGLGF